MNWEAVSAIAEIIGLVVVVVSVLYLAVQVRNQTREYKMAGIHNVTQSLMDSYAGLEDTNAAEVWSRATKDYDSISDAEKIQVFAFCQRYFRAVEDTYYQAADNRLEATYWEGVVRFQSKVLAADCVEKFWRLRGDCFSEEFQKFIAKIERTEYQL